MLSPSFWRYKQPSTCAKRHSVVHAKSNFLSKSRLISGGGSEVCTYTCLHIISLVSCTDTLGRQWFGIQGSYDTLRSSGSYQLEKFVSGSYLIPSIHVRGGKRTELFSSVVCRGCDLRDNWTQRIIRFREFSRYHKCNLGYSRPLWEVIPWLVGLRWLLLLTCSLSFSTMKLGYVLHEWILMCHLIFPPVCLYMQFYS